MGSLLSEVLFIAILMILLIIISLIAWNVFSPIKDEDNNLQDIGIRGLTILGVLLVIIAVIMPFRVRENFIEKYKTIDKLGPIGDFIGGTTVAFLTAASVVLLLATIIMQRKEIKISQRSIDELVKQTSATVEQAEEARKETKLTNETMRRQQFENTFFNMINLHHNILKEVKIEQSTGRAAIERLYDYLGNTYNGTIYSDYSLQLKTEAISGDEELLDDLIKQWYIDFELSLYINEFEQHFIPGYDEKGILDTTELDDFYSSIDNGTNIEWNRRQKKHLLYYEQNIKGNLDEYRKIIKQIDFNYSTDRISNVYIDMFNENFRNNPKKELKVLAYEKVYKEYENEVGHYYRNLYRLVKLIQNETFNTDEEVNELEKQKYRGILRAQLSSFELLMIFYNVVYSEKGKKFKDILRSTNFFDDHLIIEDFIWKNDKEELICLDTP